MKKKTVAMLMATLMAIGVLAGCGSSDSATESTSTAATEGTDAEASADTAASSADGKTTITFWHYMSEDKEGQFVNAAIDEFNNSQDEI